MLAQGSLLAQLRPGDTNKNTLFLATMRTEVTLILAASADADVNYELHHDVGGESFDDNNLIATGSMNVDEDPVIFQAMSEGSGIHLAPGDALGVSIDAADDLIFSVYGVTETLAERVRGLTNA